MIVTTIKGVDLRIASAPGLFARWAVDAGTLAMLSCVTFDPNDKILDLGCGCGIVGLVAAKIVQPDQVYLVDIDPAAVAVTAANLKENEIEGAHVALSDGFRQFTETGFTKILLNPPYHADFAVPKHFIEKGFNRLIVGGAMFMVTKRELWYRKKFEAIFGGVRVREIDGYFVFEAVKKTTQYANRSEPRVRRVSKS